MVRKIYQLSRPQNTASIILTGKRGNRVRLDFKGGSVIQNIPATLSLENPYCQQLLEESDYFKKGLVRLRQVIDDTPKVEKKPLKKIKGLTNAQQLITYVANEWGEKVTTAQRAIEFARKKGVEFPDYK